MRVQEESADAAMWIVDTYSAPEWAATLTQTPREACLTSMEFFIGISKEFESEYISAVESFFDKTAPNIDISDVKRALVTVRRRALGRAGRNLANRIGGRTQPAKSDRSVGALPNDPSDEPIDSVTTPSVLGERIHEWGDNARYPCLRDHTLRCTTRDSAGGSLLPKHFVNANDRDNFLLSGGAF